MLDLVDAFQRLDGPDGTGIALTAPMAALQAHGYGFVQTPDRPCPLCGCALLAHDAIITANALTLVMIGVITGSIPGHLRCDPCLTDLCGTLNFHGLLG